MAIYEYNENGYFISKELTETYNVNAFGVDYARSGNKMCIFMNPPVGRYDLFYMKVFDNDLFNATKVARISLLKPEYIHCSDNPEWILNEQEKQDLIDILQSNTIFDHLNNWELILFHYQSQLEFAGYDISKIQLESLPMPDYSKL